MATRGSAVAGGFALASAAAVAFGATTPVVQKIGREVGPFATAAFLYFGAGLFALVTRKPTEEEAPLRWAHAPRLLAIAVAGALVAPVALAWGLQHTSGASAALMLNVEAPMTVLLGALIHREPIGRRVGLGVALLFAGALVLVGGGATRGHVEAAGLLAVLLATVGWALDNAWTAPLSAFDSSSVVLVKTLAGAAMALGLSRSFSEQLPPAAVAGGLLVCGATGYGASLRLYILAQRRLGSARTASIFSAAPFVALLVALGLGQHATVAAALACVPMLAGLYLHWTERHEHAHRHERLVHEHAHRHDDGHHDHPHDPRPIGAHSHVHTHEAIEHAHEHMPDAHHGHAH